MSSNIPALRKRVDGILARIEPRLPGSNQKLELNFTEQERAVFHTLLEQVEPRLSEDIMTGRVDYSRLTDRELEQLHTWCLLSEALDSGDTATAETYRLALLKKAA